MSDKNSGLGGRKAEGLSAVEPAGSRVRSWAVRVDFLTRSGGHVQPEARLTLDLAGAGRVGPSRTWGAECRCYVSGSGPKRASDAVPVTGLLGPSLSL